jgi:hypothetical protein
MFEIRDSAEMIAEVGTSLQLVVIDLSLFIGVGEASRREEKPLPAPTGG